MQRGYLICLCPRVRELAVVAVIGLGLVAWQQLWQCALYMLTALCLYILRSTRHAL